MSHGFNLDSPLVCEGIIGDGCGGGRLFLVEEDTLLVYDPMTKEKHKLLTNILNAQEISKSACLITVVCKDETIKFDLSELKSV
ncbi:MAG: thiamine biosynthesis protein ThiF [Campylobacterota bacterium]|nr:thiamine biosynthesis protein ThiF [Campylobacterota bacterium]